jgi:hypothetical protein
METPQNTRMKIYNIILQSTDKKTGTNVDFTIDLQEPIKNVVAIRPLDITITATSAASNLLIALNDYTKYLPVTDNQVRVFARANTGTTVFPAITSYYMDDPYTYILNPVEPRLQRFQVALYNSDYTKYATTTTTISMTLAIYTA